MPQLTIRMRQRQRKRGNMHCRRNPIYSKVQSNYNRNTININNRNFFGIPFIKSIFVANLL